MECNITTPYPGWNAILPLPTLDGMQYYHSLPWMEFQITTPYPGWNAILPLPTLDGMQYYHSLPWMECNITSPSPGWNAVLPLPTLDGMLVNRIFIPKVLLGFLNDSSVPICTPGKIITMSNRAPSKLMEGFRSATD